jgi:N-acetylated-alpha-linked acidic dipeptidase
VQVYLTEVQQLLKTEQEAIAERNRQIEDGVFAAIADPRRPIKAPLVERLPPAINFAPLENASRSLARAAERFKKVAATARPRLAAHADVLQAVNARLIQSERQLTDEGGLPAAALVPPPPLRARVLHRVRRQDAARRARGDRAETVRRG